MTDLQIANSVSVAAIGAWAFWRLVKTPACGEWSMKLAAFFTAVAAVVWLFDRLLLDNQWRVDTLFVNSCMAWALWTGAAHHIRFERRRKARRPATRLPEAWGGPNVGSE